MVRIPACTICRTIQVKGDTEFVKANICMPEWGYRAIEELGELRNLKYGRLYLVQYCDLVQPRTIDLGHKFLQILAGTNEFEVCESREDGPCDGMWVYREGESRSELKDKCFEPGQLGQTDNHCRGINHITGFGYFAELKLDEVTGCQKE